MCGIAGIFDARGVRPIDESILSRMNALQFHRGPDDGGLHIEPGVGLAHRRLAILDLSAAGHQPLFNQEGTVGVVYNGEIYNFLELRDELEALGYRFRSRCDTEVIVHAWSAWGETCVERFRGMFAFALWDSAKETLFLARDRLGIKPLHYAWLPDGRLVFASELKAVASHPEFRREMDLEAVEDYFAFGYVPDPRTIYRQARKLAPGHRLQVVRGRSAPEPECYWDVRLEEGVARSPEVEAELIARLDEAVRIRQIADVPLGAFLSGGVDSSAVVAMMARNSQEPVRTSSISFGHEDFDEARYAAQVAERYGTDHRVRELSPDDFDLIDELAGLYDEPFADSSAMPTYRVCELARSRVTVALSGDGGDEVFAGYRRYRWYLQEQKVRRLLPRPLRGPLFGMLGTLYPKLDGAPRFLRAKATFQALALDPLDGYMDGLAVTKAPVRGTIYSDHLRKSLGGYTATDVLRRHAGNGPDHPLLQAQYLDLKTYLPGDILTKVDRASMAHSLEVRVPILDHPFVEWAAGLPMNQKMRRGQGKDVFKRALRPYISDDILYRRKMGFAVPVAAWFRGPLRERVRQAVLGPTLLDTGLFDPAGLRRLVDEHQSGRRDHSAPLWSLLMFESFCRDSIGVAGHDGSMGKRLAGAVSGPRPGRRAGRGS